jgi:hypothetical protein
MNTEKSEAIELLGGLITVDSQQLVKRSRANDRHVVILSGTLLEGIGNSYSDLDLYVIGEQLPTKAPGEPVSLVVREDGRVRRINERLNESDGTLLDVQHYTFRELDTLARSLHTLYMESRQSSRRFRKSLHHEDEDLIHKLLTGVVLQDGPTVFDPRKTFDSSMFCFLKYRNEAGGYAEFRDLVGSWTSEDLDSCLFNVRGYLIAQVSAMMFLAGGSNPRPKWFIRKLASMGQEYSELRDRIMAWMYGAYNSPAQKRTAIEEACDLIDSAFSHHRRLLDKSPKYFRAEEALALTDREFAQRKSRDRDTMTEWRLRHKMFDATAPRLFSLLTNQPPAASSATELSYAEVR